MPVIHHPAAFTVDDEEKLFMLDVYNKLAAAKAQIAEGKVLDGGTSLKSIREKYNV